MLLRFTIWFLLSPEYHQQVHLSSTYSFTDSSFPSCDIQQISHFQSMARALLSAIVEQLGPFISSEFTLTATVKQEVQKLETKFRTIQAVLNDAEKRQLKEEAVKLWLDKLKCVSYEMDDVLDERNTAMIKEEIEKQQKEDENAETSPTKKRKVWSLISVPNLFQHRDIAHKIKDLNEKLDEINKEREMYGFELSKAIEEVVERPKTTSYVDVSDILGRDKVKDDLVSILLGKGTEKEKCPCHLFGGHGWYWKNDTCPTSL